MRGLRNLISGMLLALAFAAMLTSGPAAAKDTILTVDSATRFVDSFPEMRDLAISEGLKIGANPDVAKDPMKAVIDTLKKSKLGSKVEKISKAHGFASVIEWADTGTAVARAYLFVSMGPSRGTAREAIRLHKDEAISQIEKMGILNEDGKKMLREGLKTFEDELSHTPPEENVAVVKKVRSKIDAAMQFDGSVETKEADKEKVE